MVAVVIPSYKVKAHILKVIAGIGPEVNRIYVVDDFCPQHSGDFVKENCTDARVRVLYHTKNQGVGGATITGYKQALADKARIIVKLDGDGQMDSSLIPKLIEPLRLNQADYVKGNRFYDLAFLRQMPFLRKLGNSGVSFMNKASSGYWNIMDPSNGFTAIHCNALENLPLERIDKRFFFESDMLFRLNTIRAVVAEMPMRALYGDEQSNLRVHRVVLQFPFKYINRMFKRIFYNYYLRDFNIGSLELILAFVFIVFGVIFGTYKWSESIITSHPATAGTVILAGLPIILGFQSLFAFLHFDVSNIPQKPLSGMGDW
ncbi:MAG: glycosyltransferase family 2 protein [Bacteroidetes bacterium]|nr:glycosyltransferase family 2 protein [Bacteroidota bacterium]